MYLYGSNNAGTSIASATNEYDTLCGVSDTPDPETVCNGTSFPTVPDGAIIDKIDLFVIIKGTSSFLYEVTLLKNKNNNFAASTPSGSAFGTGDQSAAAVSFRKAIMSYNPIYISSQTDAKPIPMRISRDAFMRNRRLDEDDSLVLLIQNPHASNAMTYWMFGSITVHY